MSILGVVVSHADPAALARVVAAHPWVVAVGQPNGVHLPLVLCTDTFDEDESAMLAMADIPGVVAVELAFASPTDLVGKQVGQ